MGFNKSCGQCAWPGLNKGICPFFQEPRGGDMEACPRFATEIRYCEICGRPILRTQDSVLIEDSRGEYRTICNQCGVALKTCAGCQNGRSCAFENDPRPDKIILKTIRQGNAILQKQVRNPEIIRDTCAKGCKCFSEEFGCLREINCCGNHNTILEDYLIK